MPTCPSCGGGLSVLFVDERVEFELVYYCGECDVHWDDQDLRDLNPSVDRQSWEYDSFSPTGDFDEDEN